MQARVHARRIRRARKPHIDRVEVPFCLCRNSKPQMRRFNPRKCTSLCCCRRWVRVQRPRSYNIRNWSLFSIWFIFFRCSYFFYLEFLSRLRISCVCAAYYYKGRFFVDSPAAAARLHSLMVLQCFETRDRFLIRKGTI